MLTQSNYENVTSFMFAKLFVTLFPMMLFDNDTKNTTQSRDDDAFWAA